MLGCAGFGWVVHELLASKYAHDNLDADLQDGLPPLQYDGGTYHLGTRVKTNWPVY